MGSSKQDEETKAAAVVNTEGSPVAGHSPPTYTDASVQEDQAYVYKDDQKLGYTATVFVILNKMIGTGSMCLMSNDPESSIADYSAVFSTPSGIFKITGSVGVCLFLCECPIISYPW